jgi:hypothetical protein
MNWMFERQDKAGWILHRQSWQNHKYSCRLHYTKDIFDPNRGLVGWAHFFGVFCGRADACANRSMLM